MRIGHSPAMVYWMRKGFPGSQRFYNRPILCAGVMLGTARGFQSLWSLMQPIYRKTATQSLERPNDQGVLNYLYYNGSLRDVNVYMEPRGHGIVNTVGWLLMPPQGRAASPAAACIDAQDGFVYDDDGETLSPVVHRK